MEHEGDSDTNFGWCTSNNLFVKGLEDLETLQVVTIQIDQNTEKSPGDLRRFAVTQTTVENHQLTLVWKTVIEVMIIKCH